MFVFRLLSPLTLYFQASTFRNSSDQPRSNTKGSPREMNIFVAWRLKESGDFGLSRDPCMVPNHNTCNTRSWMERKGL